MSAISTLEREKAGIPGQSRWVVLWTIINLFINNHSRPKAMNKSLKAITVSAFLCTGLQSPLFPMDTEKEKLIFDETARIELSHKEFFFSDLPIEIQANLPTDVMIHIFSFLDQRDFWKASWVCRQWREAAYEAAKSRLLDLSDKKLGQEGCQAILCAPFCTLVLKNCHLGKQEALILSQATWIKKLNLSNNGISIEGATAIANLTALASLNLGTNNIRAEGAIAISNNLTALTSLNLVRNNIGDEGAIAIAHLTALTSLNLGTNNIGDKGAIAIAHLTDLTSLSLGHNNIGNEGVRSIANKLTSLTFLDLTDNNIGDEGARAIANTNLPALTTLNLWDNNIGNETKKYLKIHTSIRELCIGSDRCETH